MIRPLEERRSFETNGGTVSLALREILWAEGVGAETLLHLTDRTLRCKTPFESLRPRLGDSFMFCLTRGVVNELHIRRFLEAALLLDNGEKLEVSPFLLPQFHEKYCRDMARLVWED